MDGGVHASDLGYLAILKLLLRLLVLIDEFQVELCHLSLRHSKDAACSVCNASELGHFKIYCSSFGDLIDSGQVGCAR